MTDDHLGVLLEDIQDKLHGLADSVSALALDMGEVKRSIAPLPKMAADIEVIKAAQTDQGRQLRHHENYLQDQGMPSRA